MFTEQVLIFQEGTFVHRTDTFFREDVFSFLGTDTLFSEGMSAHRTDTSFFQEALSAHRTDIVFPGRYVCSPNRYQFSRSTFYVFPEFFQEYLLGYRTDTDFPERLF